ncbi:uncharacterized protein EDB93DRAFT_1255917 [Suillus bovinus]|uniref:uncharacterized protein n=1 Tax=Suillus bovinus TaxID=48563 RepID=UPI001B86251F|nr:uncharacterized protein EDB93DRAFT_1255917 [Suillus bovinus]KAG2130432.1 hypothetical protein EDB93DRAFT_1255917 [Suillus bovinus]
MQYALACEDLWCHVNTNPDPMDILGLPSVLPVPVDPANVTAAEQTLMHEWLLNNIKAKDLITHHISPSVGVLVLRAHTVTSRMVWQILTERFDCMDTHSADATDYVGQYAVLCKRLCDSGAALRDSDAIYSLLIGLPQMPIWQQFKSMLEQCMHDEVMMAAAGTASIFTVESCISCITAEAAQYVHTKAIHSRPGSEYANAASSNSTTPSTNPITGLCKHRHNPDSVFCTMPGCHKGNHDHAHCYGKGGGMEGQAPWLKNKRRETAVAAAATTSAPTPTPAPAAPAIAAAVTGLSSLMADMSFTSVSEIVDDVSCLTSLPFSTILDSGMTVTLVKDKRLFHTYTMEVLVPVRTANHGTLETTR